MVASNYQHNYGEPAMLGVKTLTTVQGTQRLLKLKAKSFSRVYQVINMELIHGNQNLLKKKKLRVSKLISSMPKKPQ